MNPLTDSGKQAVRSFKAALAGIKRSRRFIDWRESAAYVARLRSLLQDLAHGVADPRTGTELVAAFFRVDSHIFNSCDDSSGRIGSLFKEDARDLFVRYAADCNDKEWLANLLFDLLQEDSNGVRDSLLEVSARFFPEQSLRSLADRFWEGARPGEPLAGLRTPRTHDDWARWHMSMYVEIIARELNDPALYERACRFMDPELGTASCTRLARAWLDAGHAGTALIWLDRVAADVTFMARERDDLRRLAHQALGNREEVERLLWKRFREERHSSTLDQLLGTLGEHRRQEVVAAESRIIAEAPGFDPRDAAFLLEFHDAEFVGTLVVDRCSEIDGNDWTALRPLARDLEKAGQLLAATVTRRALVDAILARGYAGAYRFAGEYLARLDELATRIEDWRDVPPHAEYIAGVRTRHGRKSSFWEHYEAASRPHSSILLDKRRKAT